MANPYPARRPAKTHLGSVRLANVGDAPQILDLLTESISQNFRVNCTYDITMLIENCTLSICQLDQQKAIIGFLSARDDPLLPSVHPSAWEEYVWAKYKVKEMNSRNTLFIHLLCWNPNYGRELVDNMLRSMFMHDAYILHIAMIKSLVDYPQLMHGQARSEGSFRRVAAMERGICGDKLPALWIADRLGVCPRLKIRRAVEEDNDDLVPILEQHSERLRELYGDFYISELISRHPESGRVLLVCEHSELAVGVMCLSTMINYESLEDAFVLLPFGGLKHVDKAPKDLPKTINSNSSMLVNVEPPPKPNQVTKDAISVSKDHASTKSRVTWVFEDEDAKNFKSVGVKPSTTERAVKTAAQEKQKYNFSWLMLDEELLQNQSVILNLFQDEDEEEFEFDIINIDTDLLRVPEMVTYDALGSGGHVLIILYNFYYGTKIFPMAAVGLATSPILDSYDVSSIKYITAPGSHVWDEAVRGIKQSWAGNVSPILDSYDVSSIKYITAPGSHVWDEAVRGIKQRACAAVEALGWEKHIRYDLGADNVATVFEMPDPIRYSGTPNAFILELFAIHPNYDERYGFDMLEVAYEMFPDRDYCVVCLPTNQPAFPLLEHFTLVTPYGCKKRYMNESLYVAHVNSIRGRMSVRPGGACDLTPLKEVLENAPRKDKLLDLFQSTLMTKTLQSYTLLSENQPVGVVILGPLDNGASIRTHYDLEPEPRQPGSDATILAGVLSPAFEPHARWFLRELLRLSQYSTLFWICKLFAKGDASPSRNMMSLASHMNPVHPRVSLPNISGNKELEKSPSRNMMSLASHMNPVHPRVSLPNISGNKELEKSPSRNMMSLASHMNPVHPLVSLPNISGNKELEKSPSRNMMSLASHMNPVHPRVSLPNISGNKELEKSPSRNMMSLASHMNPVHPRVLLPNISGNKELEKSPSRNMMSLASHMNPVHPRVSLPNISGNKELEKSPSRNMMSLASHMNPVHPRVSLPNISGNKELEKVYQNLGCPFALWVCERPLTSLPKVNVNTSIVVVGASRTGLAFLETLLLGPSSQYLTFSNVTLISEHGVPDVGDCLKAADTCVPKDGRYTDRYLKCMPFYYYLDIMSAVMVKIDRKRKCIHLKGGGYKFYDELVLTCGEQFQHPDYLKESLAIVKEVAKGKPCERVLLDDPKHVPDTVPIPPEMPENVFLISSLYEANRCLRRLMRMINEARGSLVLSKDNQVIVYGDHIEAYSCIAALLELGLTPEMIVFVEPFPSIEDPAPLRVNCFNDETIDARVQATVEKLGIRVLRQSHLAAWHQIDNRVESIDFMAPLTSISLRCFAVFYYGLRAINLYAFKAINECGLVYDGGLVVGPTFETNDPCISGAGTCVRYSRRLYASRSMHRYHCSEDIGEALGRLFLHKLDPFMMGDPELCSAPDDLLPRYSSTTLGFSRTGSAGSFSRLAGTTMTQIRRWQPVMKFESPMAKFATLPGPLYYLKLRKPGKEIPMAIQQSLPRQGHHLVTDKKDNYFHVHLNVLHVVDGVTCLSHKRFSPEIYQQLYGKHEAFFNKLHVRYLKNEIEDFYEFFTQPWMSALYQETFRDLINDINDQDIATVKDLVKSKFAMFDSDLSQMKSTLMETERDYGSISSISGYLHDPRRLGTFRSVVNKFVAKTAFTKARLEHINIPSECGQSKQARTQVANFWKKAGGKRIVMAHVSRYIEKNSVTNPHFASPKPEN